MFDNVEGLISKYINDIIFITNRILNLGETEQILSEQFGMDLKDKD